ncbi:Bestrophin, RFP-TM, chloride channel-domain-containing protein [Dichomitus squalens]|uniref:Bestrophin, RFP-TM, chloride channel-domain-containing protein n=1 Tax=Dichomitus squalens TaxID=114155 RepID=A0A4Q9MN31_9APHY|nr:Bestrophin, RFP-TM, chloride channel-domain-containing protein [Dichomitus squalens]
MASISVLKSSTVTVKGPKGTKIITRQKLRKYSWLPDVLRLKGSVVPRIVGPVLTVTIFATAAAYLWAHGTDISLTNSVVPLLSVVVGLILVFRNGTSYDRYWEGRKDFGTMVSHIRNLSRLIWINVSLPPPDDASRGKAASANLTPAQLRRRKVVAIKLSLSFAYAVKHYLRGEDGLDWDDYAGILPARTARLYNGLYQPPNKDYKYSTVGTSGKSTGYASYAATEYSVRRDSPEGIDTGSSTPGADTLLDVERGRQSTADATKRVRVKRSKDRLKAPGQKSTTPLMSSLQHTIDFSPDPDSLSTPLPMVIAHELSHALFKFRRDGYLETVGPAGMNAMNTLIQGMIDMMTCMERVANTPIPRSYSIHLKQCVTLYLFSLPFTLVRELGWGMIPIVTVVAFTLMGIEGIAEEIEMPFGLDSADLPLERYCEDLKEEIEFMVEKLPEGGQGMGGYDDGEGDD